MDMSSLMQQAKQMQEKMATMQETMKDITATGSAGGGMVTVTANGRNEILAVEIEQNIISANEKEMLQDLITAATNDALRKVQAISKEEMSKIAGGMNIPGVSNLFS